MAFSRIDENVWAPLDSAVQHFTHSADLAGRAGNRKAEKVFVDQYFRTRALTCLYTTLRNTAVWIYAVHEYRESADPDIRSEMRRLLDEMIEKEIQNCKELIRLWEEAPVEWMIVSGAEETPFIHAGNFAELVAKKISLMEEYRGYEPSVDPKFMFRIANNPYKK